MTLRHPPSHYEQVIQSTGIKSFILLPPLSAWGGEGILFSPDHKFAAVIWKSTEVMNSAPASTEIDLYQTGHGGKQERRLADLHSCGGSIRFSDDSLFLAFFQWLDCPRVQKLKVFDLLSSKVLAEKVPRPGVFEIVSFVGDEIVLLGDPLLTKTNEAISLTALS